MQALSRRDFLVGGATAGLVGLAGCTGLSTYTVSRGQTYTVDGGTLVVGTDNGDVTVRRGYSDKLNVSYSMQTNGPKRELDRLTFDVVTGSENSVVAEIAGGFFDLSVDLDIDVPEGVTVQTVRSGNGDVTVEEVAGDLVAETENGAVVTRNVDGHVTLRSANGDLFASGLGGIVAAETGNGDVDVEIRSLPGDATIRSGNGDVTVRVGADLDGTVRAETGNGAVTYRDLSLVTTHDEERLVEGSLNGSDGPRIDAHTGNGDVELRTA
ncbi:DUF4097 family beta strand repeat-containing protein [Haloarchaeobius sp. DFWS5]|uniref:DUF4097 family beta strand repeat-containing protein n=1 Tax=Haloarchaeobius sp. DFWS5 TaxID=3446114 RepID=UPI003EBCFF58